MEFIDLKEQYRRYKTELDERLQRVLDHLTPSAQELGSPAI